MKVCNGPCKQEKEDSEFHIKKYKSGHVGLRAYCKTCSKAFRDQYRKDFPKDNERNKAYNKLNAQKIRGKKLVKYWPGITWVKALELWQDLHNQQSGKCAICPRKTLLHVDHCHKSLEVRGLLCNKCNRGLGMMNDDINLLNGAIKYLQKYKKKLKVAA